MKGSRKKHSPSFKAKVALKEAELSSSSYYYHPAGTRKPKALDMELVAAITAVRQGLNEVYGYRKITQSLKVQGMTVNAKKVLRHLHTLGLTQPRKVKGIRWTQIEVIKPETLNSYWEADFTYVYNAKYVSLDMACPMKRLTKLIARYWRKHEAPGW